MTDLDSSLEQAVRACALAPAAGSLAEGARRSYRFGPDFPGFRGHFPGAPIVPAIVQVLAAQLLVTDLEGPGQVLGQVENAKFLKQILPGMEVHVTCTATQRGGRTAYSARVEADGALAATFVLGLQDPEGPA